MLKISLFYHIFYFKNLNKLIFEQNYFNTKKLLKLLFENSNIFLLGNSLDYKYSWSKIYESEIHGGETNLNFFYKKSVIKINLSKFTKKNYKLKKISDLHNLIIFKKKTSLIKKKIDYDYIILNRINSLNKNFNKNFNKNNIFSIKKDSNYLKNRFKRNKKLGNRVVDFKKKAKLFYNTNRLIAKKFLKIKKIKQHAISKKLKFICNLKKLDFLIKLENSIFNIVMQSDFFFSSNDFHWFFKNGFIYLNSVCVDSYNLIVKPLDIIQIVNFSQYYIYYKNSLSYLMSKSFIISKKLWSINKNRYKTAYFRDVKTLKYIESFPKILENYKYFKKDIPIFLEVDYVSMTIILLYNNKKANFMNFYNLKFFNFYLNRLYNWNFIV